MNEPKITVIIPTRERSDVLEKSLQTVTSQDYDNLEIVVSDNCSSDNTEEIIRSANDGRVRYLNPGRRLSMSHHWEFALSHLVDGWVTILGDDDGLLPAALEKVSDIARASGLQAIRSDICHYQWPSVTGEDFGRLYVPLGRGREIRESTSWLPRVMNGVASYLDLPMLYSGGFIDVGILKGIRRKTGAVYLSSNPDVYSAFAVSSVVQKYVYSNEPLAIGGASKHSIGMSHFSAGKGPDRTPAAVFHREGNIPFHEELPLCADGTCPPSVQALVYESYLQSQSLRGEVEEPLHLEQLELILATSGDRSSAVAAWSKLFMRAHGLTPRRSRVARRRLALALASAPKRALQALNRWSIESSETPIRDVYEASIAAARVRSHMPSPPQRVRCWASRRLSSLKLSR